MWKYIFKVGSTNSIGNAKCFSVTRTHIFLIFTILLLCHIFKKENPFWEEFFFQRLTCWTLKRYHYSYFELLFALDIFFPTYWAIFIMALGIIWCFWHTYSNHQFFQIMDGKSLNAGYRGIFFQKDLKWLFPIPLEKWWKIML